MDKKAYTLLELMIVVAIVLILAGAAIIGSSGIVKNIQFGNAFNKTVFMVQKARNLAINGKNTAQTPAVNSYAVKFDMPAAPGLHSVAIVALGAEETIGSGDEEMLETYILTNNMGIELLASDVSSGASGTACTGSAVIYFENKTGNVSFDCTGGPDAPNIMQFGIQETGDATTARTFLIHRAVGTPQI